MNATTTELEKDLKKGLALLKTMRDEVRVKLHLASMDAKDQWQKLEPHLANIEQTAEDITETSRAAVIGAVNSLRKFRDSLS